MKIRIYVMTHKKFEMPQSPLFRPLHVGRACGEDLGYPVYTFCTLPDGPVS